LGLSLGKVVTYSRGITIKTNAMVMERCIGVMALFTKAIGSPECNKEKEDLNCQMVVSKRECSGKTNTLELRDKEILLFGNSNSSKQFLNKMRFQKLPSKKPAKALIADLFTK
jgi:hypothetical protein